LSTATTLIYRLTDRKTNVHNISDHKIMQSTHYYIIKVKFHTTATLTNPEGHSGCHPRHGPLSLSSITGARPTILAASTLVSRRKSLYTILITASIPSVLLKSISSIVSQREMFISHHPLPDHPDLVSNHLLPMLTHRSLTASSRCNFLDPGYR